jgi:DNA ligase-associated metallophosphoesterase
VKAVFPAYSHERRIPALLPVLGLILEATPEGALWWEDEATVIVADLHLEKGSSFARRGMFLPPYDTTATLAVLAALFGRLNPKRVIALGDSFHDPEGSGRLSVTDRATLLALQQGRDWIWVAGNHDPHPPRGVRGDCLPELALGPLLLRHEPSPGAAPGEVAGHLHPAARVAGRLGSVRRRCFAGDGQRVVLPAMGAYAGGLNVLDKAFAPVFSARRPSAFVIGDGAVYPVRGSALRPD